jgi:hypothetical protein
MSQTNNWALSRCCESKERDSQPLLLLFSSGHREIYAQDIYNAMAYPPGVTIQFRYDEDWVADTIKSDELEGRKALIIAAPKIDNELQSDWNVDFKHEGEYAYFPLRVATVSAAYERGDIQHVYLELGHTLVDYTELGSDDPECDFSGEDSTRDDDSGHLDRSTQQAVQMTEVIGKQRKRPIKGKSNNSDDRFFVEADPALDSDETKIRFTCSCEVSQNSEDSDNLDQGNKYISICRGNIHRDECNCWEESSDEWATIVSALSAHPSFASDLFIKLEKPRISSSVTRRSQLRNSLFGLFQPTAHPDGVSEGRIATIKDVATEAGPPETEFRFYSGYQYRMRSLLMFAGEPKNIARNSNLELEGGSYLDVFPESEPLGFRVNEVTFTVDPEPQKKRRHSELTLRSATPDSSSIEIDYDDKDKPQKAEILPYNSVQSSEGSFRGPRLRLPVRLWPDFNYRRGPALLAMFGIFILIGSGALAELLGVATPQQILGIIPRSIRMWTEDIIRIIGLGTITYGFNIYED